MPLRVLPPPHACPRRLPPAPAPPSEADCGKPKQRRFPGKYLVYTDASAMRPKDPYLRRAACAFWARDSKSDSAAWSLTGPVQTAYHAELFAILVALKLFRGEIEIVSNCRGAWTRLSVSELAAGSATSKHADLWVRYRNALSAEGLSRVYVRWVLSHEKERSNCISADDRNGNEQADRLANARAKRIGPTASQGKLYDRMTRQLAAIQSIQLKILTASQASDPPKAQDQARRGPSAARGRGHSPAPPQEVPPPHPGARGAASVGAPPHRPPWHGGLQVHHLHQGCEPQEGQVRAQDLAVLGPLWPGRLPPIAQTQVQMEQSERGQVETPGGGRPPGRQVQLHPIRLQVALHETRTPLRSVLRPPHKTMRGGAGVPGRNQGHR